MQISIVNTDILSCVADLIVLKHADGYHGADLAVARAVGFMESLLVGEARIVSAKGTGARQALFMGVGPLHEFGYEKIQEFGAEVLRKASSYGAKHVATTIHGPGYGLDIEQAFLSLIAGFASQLACSTLTVDNVSIIEMSSHRYGLLQALLDSRRSDFGFSKPAASHVIAYPGQISVPSGATAEILHFGAVASQKPKLFVAMPFSDEYLDEYFYGICGAGKQHGYICERLDLEHYTGDIVSEIKKRIVSSHGVIALLNGRNPNVFLEVGYSWANNRPTILILKDGEEMPFDVRGQRCIRYKSIIQLEKALADEIGGLKAKGLLLRA